LIAGQHNVENALAALALTRAWDVSPEVIAEALREFRGVPYRLERVRELDGVQYINDATATAPSATIVALRTLTSNTGTIYLIAGGSDKGLPYDEMAKAVKQLGTKVILLEGSATEQIERALIGAGAEEAVVARTKTLDVAVHFGHGAAKSGDTVLLSPGAASFGMFVNEFDRGDQFREIVESLR
jgi:UDP-N-acetylmuramoylalanine--D-glutamate ligase